MRGSRLRAHAAVAAATGAMVGALAWVLLAADVAPGVRTDAIDGITPHVEADPRVAILAFDEDLVEQFRADPLPFVRVEQRWPLPRAPGDPTMVMSEEALELLNPGFSRAEWHAAVAARFSEVPGIVLSRDDVALVDAPDRALPTLVDAEPTALDDAAVDAVAFAATAPGSGEDRVRTVGLAAARDDDGEIATVPSSVLAALLSTEGLDPVVELRAGELGVGDRALPTEAGHRLRVSYSDDLLPGGAAVLSASEPRPPDIYEEKAVVIVGVTDPAIARMLPVGPNEGGRLPSVFVEANALNTALTASWQQPASFATQAALATLVGFVVAFLSLWLPLAASPLVAIAAGALAWWGAGLAAARGRILDIALLLLAVLVAYASTLAWRAVREVLRRRRITRLFSVYVPDTVARELVEPAMLASVTEGRRLDLSVMFCDLRGFTPLSAKLDPSAVREMLDLYYERASEVILLREGTVMQFVGDEVFAAFGAPLEQQDHAARAMDAGLALLDLHGSLCAELAARELPAIDYGIGINSGSAVAAHAGSNVRRQYTVIGDTVNVGSRLCGQAAAGEIVVSEATIAALDGPPSGAVATGPLTLKGVAEPRSCFLIRRPGPTSCSEHRSPPHSTTEARLPAT